jgi:ATP-dependent Clp protease ATP-binding subunit ClpA
LEEAAMAPERKATYAYEAFTPEAQQALLRAQSLAEEAHHPVIGVAHLMAAVAHELGSSPDAIMQAAAAPTSGPGQPMPGAEVQTAIAAAFSAAGVTAPGSPAAGVSTRHLAIGCVETPDGRAIADRLRLNPG